MFDPSHPISVLDPKIHKIHMFLRTTEQQQQKAGEQVMSLQENVTLKRKK